MRISDWSSDVCSSDLESIRLVVERLLHILQHRCCSAQKIITGHGLAIEFARFVIEPVPAQHGNILRSKIAPTHFNNDRCAFLHPIPAFVGRLDRFRSEEHTSELQSLMRISYAVFCVKKKTTTTHIQSTNTR